MNLCSVIANTQKSTVTSAQKIDKKQHKQWLLKLIAISTLIMGQPVTAQTPLTGSGNHLPLPSPNLTLSPVFPNYSTGNPFAGTWTTPAASPWIGTFTGTGDNVLTGMNTGTGNYDFTSLGGLPIGTYFGFGDVDFGSATNEVFTLQAFDLTNRQITQPWLSVPISASLSATTTQMPGWSFNNGVYRIDGTTVVGNPNIVVRLTNLISLGNLTVTRESSFGGMSLAAPEEQEQVAITESSNLLGLGILLVLGIGVIIKKS